MTLISTKAELSSALGTTDTFLILFGSDTVTTTVHEFIEGMVEDESLYEDQQTLRVEDFSFLTKQQKLAWSPKQSTYAVSQPNASAARAVLIKGSVTELLQTRTDAQGNRKPSVMNIRLAFAGGPK